MALPENLPVNLDAERLILGSILLDGSLYVTVAAALNPDDFSLEKHRRIFARIGEVHERGERIDRITVANELMRRNQLEACDGLAYLVSLDDGLPQILNLDSYVSIVKDKSTLRQIVLTAHQLMNRALLGEECSSILDAAEHMFGRLAAETQTNVRIDCAAELLGPTWELARQRAEQWQATGKPVMGILSGLSALDEILGGFEPGLYFLAGAPGAGKTSFALQIACEVCRQGVPTIYVSYENSATDLVLAAVCARAGVSPRLIRRGCAHSADLEKVQKATIELQPVLSRLVIIEGSLSLHVAAIQAKVRESLHAHEANGAFVVFDYLQEGAFAEGYKDMHANVAALAARLRDLASKLHCPVLALSSQNRAAGNYGRGGGSAALDSLKHAGELEYGARAVMFLLPDEQRSAIAPARAMSLTVSKHRFGPLGSVPLIFRPDVGIFREETKAQAAR